MHRNQDNISMMQIDWMYIANNLLLRFWRNKEYICSGFFFQTKFTKLCAPLGERSLDPHGPSRVCTPLHAENCPALQNRSKLNWGNKLIGFFNLRMCLDTSTLVILSLMIFFYKILCLLKFCVKLRCPFWLRNCLFHYIVLWKVYSAFAWTLSS